MFFVNRTSHLLFLIRHASLDVDKDQKEEPKLVLPSLETSSGGDLLGIVVQPGPAGLAVKPLGLHVVNVGSIPTGPTPVRRDYSRSLGTCLNPPRMSGRAPDQD